MGIFGSILEKLGFSNEEENNVEEVASVMSTSETQETQDTQENIEINTENDQQISITTQEVDVVAILERLSNDNSQALNWKSSIVDLMKLLNLDSSYAHRKELAVELACPQELLDDSAKMNTWLHKKVLKRLAQNGGNIPSDLYA